MLFSRDWLSDYVELPDDPRELADRLTAVGMAVEGEEARGEDVLLDVDVTTNRPDCMCHMGLAREVAVARGVALSLPESEVDEAEEATADVATVELGDPRDCPRFVARVIRGVTVGESPRWLRERLEAIGLRPINNIVDVTNYVLWETGQPLHAYDLAKVTDGHLIARRARPGETLTTLDGEERELSPEILVIADPSGPVGIGGVMGGLDSEVTEATTDVLLEGAHFDRRRVRLGAAALGLHTDASHRFERGADPEGCRRAVDRATRLMAELGGGTALAGAVDRRADDFDQRFRATGRLDHRRLERFAGTGIDPAKVEAWLTGLGFELTAADGDSADHRVWDVTAPGWRYYDMEPGPDGRIYEQDLYEEVLRLHGYDGIPSTLPGLTGSDGSRTDEQVRRDRVRDHLAACGYAEAVNYAFHSRNMDASTAHLAPAGSEPVPLVNPLSELYSVLRRSLVPNLLTNAAFNRRRGVDSVRLFEVGHVFWRGGEGGDDARRVGEAEAVAFLCGGTVGTPWDRPRELDLFDLKGVLEALGDVLETEVQVRPAELTGTVAGAAAEILVGDEVVGWIGRIDEGDSDAYPLYAAELRTEVLGAGVQGAGVQRATAGSQVTVPSRYPTVEADYTLTHATGVPWSDLAAAIESARPEGLAGYGLKDRYEGEGVPAGAVNTTLWFVYSHPERTLTHEEVNDRQEALTAGLEERFGWKAAPETGVVRS